MKTPLLIVLAAVGVSPSACLAQAATLAISREVSVFVQAPPVVEPTLAISRECSVYIQAPAVEVTLAIGRETSIFMPRCIDYQVDDAVTIEDLLEYLRIFEDGAVQADLDGGDGNGRGDGAVTIDDLLYFLGRFEAGC